MNKNGAYVGNYLGPPGVVYGHLASPVAFKPTAVKIMGAESTSTIGVNNAGVLVGQYTDSMGDTYGMMLNGSTLTRIDDPKAVAGSTWCYGINNNNQVVAFTPAAPRASRWDSITRAERLQMSQIPLAPSRPRRGISTTADRLLVTSSTPARKNTDSC